MSIVAANGTRLCDRYTLLGKLGEGGESEVWRARDHQEGKEVALKVLRPEVAQRPGTWEALERECETASGLDHPLILKLDPPVRDGDLIALPMELAPGGDLRRLCGVSYLEIVPVLIEVAQALAYAHARGVVHRDLKPGNILFDARGHVRLADFGSARTGFSPFTASPQQLRGESPAPADDIYGLGALAYELLCGHPPFHPRFEVKRVLEEPVPPLKPAHLAPGRLVTLVMSMLAKQPRARPASMKEVLEALDAALNDTLTFAYDEPPDALAARANPPGAPAYFEEPATSEAPSHIEAVEHQEALGPIFEAPEPSEGPEHLQAPDRAPKADGPLPRTHARRPPDPQSVKPSHAADNSSRSRSSSEGPSPTATSPAAAATSPAATRSPPARAPTRELNAAREAPPPGAPRKTPPPSAASLRETPPPSAASLREAPPPTAASLRAERGAPEPDMRALWGDIKVERVPNLMRLEPVRRSPWPWLIAAAMAAVAVAVFFVLQGSTDHPAWASTSSAQLRALAPPAVVNAVRSAVEVPLRAMGVQTGAESQTGAAGESGSPATRAEAPARTNEPSAGPGASAPAAHGPAASGATAADAAATDADHAAAVRAGDAAAAGSPQTGSPASGGPGNGSGVSPANRTAAARSPGANRAAVRGGPSPGVRPLLADAREAEAARDFSRAAQDYSQALSLDPGNAAARAGLNRANAAFGAGQYAQAVGAGFAALGAGRLEEARADFDRARRADPRGRDAEEGLRHVAAAMRVRDAAQARSQARADLENRLQALVDDPQRLSSPAVRAEAASLIREAEIMPSAGGAVLRSLTARLTILLPAYDKPVHLALVSDNVTEVEIPQIGSFGTFARREIDLKPGRYTVIGTRAGYREVKRDVTVAPGETVHTISIRCEEPI